MNKENMKKSAFIYLIPILFCVIESWKYFCYLDFAAFTFDKNFMLFAIFLFFTMLCIYGFCYGFCYEIYYDDKILVIKTIFKKKSLIFSELKLISCEKYTFLSKYYILKLKQNNKKITVYTVNPNDIINRLIKDL